MVEFGGYENFMALHFEGIGVQARRWVILITSETEASSRREGSMADGSQYGFNSFRRWVTMMRTLKLLGLGAGLLAAFAVTAEPAAAQSTLDIVKKRVICRCQIGTPAPGFYQLKDDGTWAGRRSTFAAPSRRRSSVIRTKLNISR